MMTPSVSSSVYYQSCRDQAKFLNVPQRCGGAKLSVIYKKNNYKKNTILESIKSA
jgi:hypothetical protein